ncbi:MAG TPA: galactokinase family protein, partial [Candidatus Acidoferrum sp.]|nr:galactokinase family protein [Candidatus Acidoferrum sp.]
MIDSFRRLFGGTERVRVFRAPGRTNLIGEHTDYNLGFVLPVALQLATYVATAPSGDGKLHIYSEDLGELRAFDVAGLADLKHRHEWSDYVIGVAQELLRLGYAIDGANLLIRSTVPRGAGLSSSAALEVSSALALLLDRAIEPLQLALLCQRAERNFVGMPCGIMDQYISIFGREHAAVEIDCRSLGNRTVPLPGGTAFVAVNSMVKHELSGSAYRDRVAECAAATEALGVESLRDVTPTHLEANAVRLSPVILRRARHIVTENDRVNHFVN